PPAPHPAAGSIRPHGCRGPAVVPLPHPSGCEAKELSENGTCPARGPRHPVRFIGSAVATLLSVALSNLFGTRGLDSADKRALVFSDSVQDASHRAGFVQARSHAFALHRHHLGTRRRLDPTGSSRRARPEHGSDPR